MRHRPTLLGLVLALSVLLGGPAAAQNVTEMYVSPDTVRLTPGQRQGLTVQAFDDAGNVVLALHYRVADSAVAQVAQNGTVTGGRGGATRIMVQAGKKSRSVAVLVSDGGPAQGLAAGSGAVRAQPVAQITLEPSPLFLLPTETGRVGVRAIAADGTPALGVRVRWRSLTSAIVAVEDSSGIITGIATGQGVVQASVPGGPAIDLPVTVGLANIVANHDQVVLSPEDSDTLAITVPAQGSRHLRERDLQWSTSDETVATVGVDGVVHALAAGRAELVVHGFLQELRIPIIVHQRIARFAVAPRLTDTVRLPVQSSREFTLIPQTSDSLPIEGIPVTWTVGDTAIATFDPSTGRLLARRAGTTTLQFAVRGFVPKVWTIEVLPGSLALARTRFALRPGERTTLAPQFVDLAGKPIAPATGLSWITSNANVARVTPEGTIEAVTPGRAVITVRAPGGEPSQATVFVTGDLLVASTRGGRFGVYTLLASRPESFFPVVRDSLANSIDASYSPDRTRIVFSSDRTVAGNYDIFSADADGGNPLRLTTGPAMDIQPVWTPDGQRVVFVSTKTGTRQIYVMRADGSETRQLTSLAGGADEPAVSPDGKTVAFTGYPAARDGQSDIFVVPLEGGAPTAMTNTPDRRETRPVYLASGELAWLVLRRDRREPDQVVRQVGPGGTVSAVVTSDVTMVDLAFAPDGSRVAWVASRPQDRNRDALEFTFQWRTLSSGTETSVRLLPGERITSPAF